MKEYVGIQYLRGIAAILVIIYHSMVMVAVAPYFPYPIGSFGVDIFFVISGFIMWTTTTRRQVSPVNFIKARLTRIYPLYWFFSCILLVSIFAIPSAFINQRSLDITYILKSLLLIPAYNPDVGDITPLYTIGWTLVYEMFFYAIFSLSLFVRTANKRLAILISFFALLVLIGISTNFKSAIAITYTSPILLEFISGIMVGVAVKKLSNLSLNFGITFLSLAVMMFIWGYLNESILSRAIAFGPAATFLVMSSIVFEKIFTTKTNKLALLLGNASFSIYLSHPFAQRAWYMIETRITAGISTMLYAVIYATGAVIIGVTGGLICYILIEKPLMSIKYKLRLSRGYYQQGR